MYSLIALLLITGQLIGRSAFDQQINQLKEDKPYLFAMHNEPSPKEWYQTQARKTAIVMATTLSFYALYRDYYASSKSWIHATLKTMGPAAISRLPTHISCGFHCLEAVMTAYGAHLLMRLGIYLFVDESVTHTEKITI